jgi:hypothetical protein
VNDVALQSAILRVLARWGTLPETDLIRWLPPTQAVEFGPAVLRAMGDAGLIVVRAVGDERVLKLTEQGRARTGGGPAT